MALGAAAEALLLLRPPLLRRSGGVGGTLGLCPNRRQAGIEVMARVCQMARPGRQIEHSTAFRRPERLASLLFPTVSVNQAFQYSRMLCLAETEHGRMARLVAGLYALDGHNAAVPLRLESVDLRVSTPDVLALYDPRQSCHTASLVQGTILGSYATVVLKVAFSLPREPVERGAYFFPLSTDSAVLGLRATIEAPGLPTRILRGAVLEKETARRGFRAAVVAGRSAAVLEVRRRWFSAFVIPRLHLPRMQREAASEDVFRLDLGCLPAGGTVEVEVQFTQALRVFRSSPSAARLVIPAALVHRYVPVAGAGIGGARFAYALASAAEALASRGDAVDHPSLCLSLVVQSIRSIQTVSSPSHAAYASTRLLATAHAASGPGGSEDAVLLSISVPKSQVRRHEYAWAGRGIARITVLYHRVTAVADSCGVR